LETIAWCRTALCSSTTCSRRAGRRYRQPELWRSTTIGNHVSIGTNSTILPVKICDHVVIGAGSVVTKDITQSGIYAGNPARLLRRL
jgi:acetyltransferase-like isoleucine patch superfamily enzyme